MEKGLRIDQNAPVYNEFLFHKNKTNHPMSSYSHSVAIASKARHFSNDRGIVQNLIGHNVILKKVCNGAPDGRFRKFLKLETCLYG